MVKPSVVRTQYPLYLLQLLHSFGSAATNSCEDFTPKYPKNRSDILRAEGVIPDVIKDTPKHTVEVEYYPHYFVNFGNELKPEIVQKNNFSIHWHHVVDEYYSYFTLLLVGLDEPTRNSSLDCEFLYWLVVNIPNDFVTKGEHLAAYIPPNPKKGTGLHRYVYIVLHQPKGKREFDETFLNGIPVLNETTIKERKRWWTYAFMKNNGLTDVHAVNFFKSG